MAKHPTRAYPPEFRHKALELVRSGRSVAEVSRQLDLSRQTIMNWMKQDDADSGRRGDLLTTDERKELTMVWMHAVTAAEIDERRAGVMFLEDRDDLRLGEARLSHTGFLSAILTGKPTISIGPEFRGDVGLSCVRIYNDVDTTYPPS